MKNFQRKGEKNNSTVGRIFENTAQNYWQKHHNIELINSYPMEIGLSSYKKVHKFDLGSKSPSIIIECKSHKWTEGHNIPSAKLTVWNEAMYYFSLSPESYRKIFFCLKDYSEKHGSTLAEYYIRTHRHLIPIDTEFWEFCEETNKAVNIYTSQ